MKESDIRPRALFNRYLELLAKDVDRFFSDRSRFVEVPCPACSSVSQEVGLNKLGFCYVTCLECGSLYVSPRPTSSMIDAYYRESEAVKFWETQFFKETAHARREKIFRPRAELVGELIQEYDRAETNTFVDVGSGYGIFLEEMAKQNLFENVLGIEPAPNLADVCRQKGFRVIEKPVEAVEKDELGADFITAFEVLEHVFDPVRVVTAMERLLRPDGILLFTTLTVSGFDIQVLWEHSDSVYPPMHINLLSVEGINRLGERCGLDIVELATPGKLDVDIVRNALVKNPDIPISRFVRSLLRRGDQAQDNFQAFLQANCFSSHVRVIARPRRG